jgi:response regulator RpfG family c-di-GMP phosphodiesterase
MNNSKTIKASRFKVLYIDDDPLQLQLFQLRYSNILEVKVAEFAHNGLEILKHHMDIDVVISDFDMPFMNGLEFIEKARRIKNDIPFYIFSSSLETEEIKDALQNKLINHFFIKPIHKSFLLNEISDFYKHK